MDFYRIRALVDGTPEERVCTWDGVESAMKAFEKIEDQDTGDRFGSFGIEVAMVHLITFSEAGAAYTDVSGQLEKCWARTSFKEALSFIRAPAQSGGAS